MQSGRQILTTIDQGIRLISDQIQEIDQQNKEQSNNLVELQKTQANRYKQMAKIRLDNVISGELAVGLDAVDQRVGELLKEREQALISLNERIKEAQMQQEVLANQREKLSGETAQATEIVDKAEAATQQRLEQDPNYQAQLKKTQEAERIAKHADEKTGQSETVREQKRGPFENDALFMYLWKRHYGTSSYSANLLARYLDHWVARLCDFQGARSNYAMLLEIPKRLREHAERVRILANEEFAALTQMEEQAAEEDGVPELKKALEQAQTRLDEVDAEIEQAEHQLREFEQQRTNFASGDDDHFKRTIDTLSSAFEQEDLRTLYEYARLTATAEDDVLVREMDVAKKQVQQIKETLIESKRVQEMHLGRLQELEEIRRRFKQQRYDGIHSEFGNGELITMVLNQFLQGTLASGELWRALEREQRYRRIESNPDFGTGGFGRGQGTWHFPFPMGGDMGGGGLGHGGGGGGDGGFKTGGGF